MEEKEVYQRGPGFRRTVVFDRSEPDKFQIFTEVDMEKVLETNKALREEIVPRSINKHLARVPMTTYEQSIREQWDDNDWKRWLNDPNNKAHRIWQGHV